MLERLAAIHTDIALDLDFGRADREYATAFRDYGIDVDRLQPADAGARIAAAPIAAEMVDALDQWAFIRRVLNPRDASRHATCPPSPRRPTPTPGGAGCATRSTWRPRTGSGPAPPSRSWPPRHPRRSCTARASRGWPTPWVISGSKETATALLRRAQRAHPDDFWINHDLARSLMGSGQPDEAVRFYSAAVAIRPRSQLALRGLREALRAAGRPG